jgi:hypothetical protein
MILGETIVRSNGIGDVVSAGLPIAQTASVINETFADLGGIRTTASTIHRSK